MSRGHGHTQREILKALAEGPSTTQELTDELVDKDGVEYWRSTGGRSVVQRALNRLVEAGEVKKYRLIERGARYRYALPGWAEGRGLSAVYDPMEVTEKPYSDRDTLKEFGQRAKTLCDPVTIAMMINTEDYLVALGDFLHELAEWAD